MNFKRYPIKLIEQLKKTENTPHRKALGFAIGIFVGLSPYWGFHTVMVLALAYILKTDKTIAVLAVFITNPLTAPLIYPVTFFVGSMIITPSKAFAPPSKITISGISELLTRAPETLWILTIGGVILGVPLAILSYCAINIWLNRRHRNSNSASGGKDPIPHLKTQT